MNEKEFKEMLVSEETVRDDVETEIEELKAEIERMIKGSSPEEKAVMEKILKVLEKHNLKYSYDEDEPKHVELGFSMKNKPFKIHIFLQNGKVIFRLSFPFRVQTNAYPLMCMFMADFNENKAFSLLNLDPDDGELTMEYSYMLENPVHFNEKYFWVYMTSLIHPALEVYTKVAHLSVGMVSGKERKTYKKLLEMAIETVNGDFDDDKVSYGTESLRLESVPKLPELFGKLDEDESKNDDANSDGEDLASDIIRSMRSGGRIPSFEEFMRMKMQSEENGDEEAEDQPKKGSSMLSMFAKRDEDMEPKAVGGNEDE